ncbi:transferase [Rhexocercosporidium sp. MPI-PUGE-AT-0058]|nr:transferase [Rhexocercosporidium sp. MPI-PUGE-AT-0058]
MSSNPTSLSGEPVEKSSFVTLEEYGLKAQSAVELKLSPLDLNMPRLYGARWILCFPLPADTDKAIVFETLKKGLAHTIASIPWLAGDVGPEIGSDPKDGRIQVVGGKGGVEFIYKDLSSKLPSYAELKKDNFTFSKLTTPLVSPLQVIQQAQPVFAAQANFIQGGLLLTTGYHHSVCDGAAQDFILETWALNTAAAAASSSSSFTKHDPVSNDRTPLIDCIPTENISEFSEYVLAPTPPADQTNMAPPAGFQMPPMTSKIFTFSPSTLAALKIEAKAYSTNDAVLGFFWHHMSVARNPSLVDETATSAALFAVNIRGRTSPPLPHTYLGNASFGSLTPRLSITSLTDLSSGLSLASSSLRSALNALNTPSRVPRTIGLLSSRSNPQDFKFAARGFLGPDITASSWADLRVREREWGVLGKPEGFRVPYEAADGSIILFPRLEGGGLEVMCALEDGAMGRMLANEHFMKFAVDGLK